MIEDLIGGLLGGAIGTGLYERLRRRRLARAEAAGKSLEFPGSVLGPTRYCHPAGGLLRVEGTTLTWLTGKGGMSFAVPAERLDVRGLAAVPRSESFSSGTTVAVICDDAGATVRILVLRADLPYLARALPGVEGLSEPAPARA
ncbi:MAG TPA: hypothetical protein VNR17_06910 [Luteimicrobium sp.]|nr:hypothetical protein [Luteimicrobium sp.]